MNNSSLSSLCKPLVLKIKLEHDLSCPWHHALSRGSQQLCLSFPLQGTFLALSRLGGGPTLFTKSYVLLENCALLGYYAANSGNYLPTFWDNVSDPSSRFNNPKRNNPYSLRNNAEEGVSHLLRGGSIKSRTILLRRINRAMDEDWLIPKVVHKRQNYTEMCS